MKDLPSPSLHIDDISLEVTDKNENLGITTIRILSCPFISALFIKVLMFDSGIMPVLDTV